MAGLRFVPRLCNVMDAPGISLPFDLELIFSPGLFYYDVSFLCATVYTIGSVDNIAPTTPSTCWRRQMFVILTKFVLFKNKYFTRLVLLRSCIGQE